jgi:hypothetical protein
MKKFVFSDNENIFVTCDCTLNDSDNQDQNFIVKNIRGIESPITTKMFSFLRVGCPVNINELNFHSLNNNLLLTVTDMNGDYENSYGSTTTTTSTSTTSTTTSTTTHAPTTTTTTTIPL